MPDRIQLYATKSNKLWPDMSLNTRLPKHLFAKCPPVVRSTYVHVARPQGLPPVPDISRTPTGLNLPLT